MCVVAYECLCKCVPVRVCELLCVWCYVFVSERVFVYVLGLVYVCLYSCVNVFGCVWWWWYVCVGM